MKSTFEKMGGTYTLGTDGIYYPNLVSTDECADGIYQKKCNELVRSR